MTSTIKEHLIAARATPGEWRYDIQYGPDGEANYAWLYDETGSLVTTLRTHQAAKIVRSMNSAPEMLEALKALRLQALQSNLNSAANEWGREAIKMSSAAIAKAEGRQP